MGAAAVGTTLSAYALARLCMNIPSGILADRRGRKPLLVAGPAVTALGAAGASSRAPVSPSSSATAGRHDGALQARASNLLNLLEAMLAALRAHAAAVHAS